jgi:hypothetical protein
MITPALALNFTSASLDPRVTFSRSGATATRINGSGFIESVAADTARFDFNPVSLACKGMLIEEARTNLLKSSAGLSTGANWATANRITVTANSGTAPDGTNSAFKLTEVAVTGTHRLEQGVGAWTPATTYTISCYFKQGAGDPFAILFTNSCFAWFNITNGTVGVTTQSGSAVAINSTITDAGDGWYRCTFTAISGAETSLFAYVAMSNADGVLSYAGDATRFLYAWGAQLEIANAVSSYIPTTTTAVTRNADVATITGTNFSDFWNASKGGAMVQAIQSTVAGIRPLVQYDDGTAGNIIALRGNAANPELQIVDGGAPQVQLDAGTIVANTLYSLTGWWQTNDCRARQNAGAVVIDNTATIPTVTQARLGSDGTNYLNGHLATINYYNKFTGQIYDRRKNKAVFSLL